MCLKKKHIPIVKVYRETGALLPRRATLGSAALDVHACLPPDTICTIPIGKRILIPTGLRFEIPEDYFISVRPRSGLALKSGLCLPNAPGTIDSDYRGELQILVANFDTEKEIQITHGERIAQILLEKIQNFEWLEIENREKLQNTQRGTNGFGSTGLA